MSTDPNEPVPNGALPDNDAHVAEAVEPTEALEARVADAPPVEPPVVDTPTESEGLPLRGEAAPRKAPERAPRDPMAAAHAALSQAAAARGTELTPLPPSRRHPFDAAQEALEKARAAREHASKGGSAGLAREADARAQLDALRTGGYSPPSPSAPDESLPAVPTPRKRTL